MAVRCINRSLDEFKLVAKAVGSPIVANSLISAWQDVNNSDAIPSVEEALKFEKQSKTAFNLKRKSFVDALYENMRRKGMISKLGDNWYVVSSKDRVYNAGIRKFNYDRIQGYLISNNIPLDIFSKKMMGKGLSIKLEPTLLTQRDILPESRSFGTNHTTELIEHLSRLFPSVEIKVLGKREAKKIYDKLPKDQKSDIKEFKDVRSFYVNGTAYLIKERVTDQIAIEEVLHPFVDSFAASNPELFNSLLEEAKLNFPELNQEIAEAYTDKRGFTQRDRELELVTQGLSRYFDKEFKTETTKTFKDRIKEFVDWFFSIVQSLGEVFTGRNLSYFRGDAALLEQERRESATDDVINNEQLANEEVRRITRLTPDIIPDNATLSDIAKFLNTSDISFDVDLKTDNNKVRYNLTPGKQEAYDYAIRQANETQKEIIENIFHAAMHSPKEVGNLAASTLKDGDPILVLDEATHTYQDLNDSATVWTSTTEAIKGKMPEDRIEDFQLNLDLGNDFDTILDGLATDKPIKDIAAEMKILDEQQFGNAYAALQANLALLTQDGSIAIPQVVVFDKSTKLAGSIDLLLVQPNGSLKIVDLKTSRTSIEDTYKGKKSYSNSKYKIGEDSMLKKAGIAEELSKEQQHNLQVNLYRRMLENMGYTVSTQDGNASTMHIHVDVTGKGKDQKFEGTFKTETWVSHPESQNLPYIDAIMPLSVDAQAKRKIDQASSKSPESKADTTLNAKEAQPQDQKVDPEYKVITQALEDYRIGLVRKLEALEMVKNNVFLGKHKSVSQLKESINNSINAITLAMSLDPKTKVATYSSLLRDAIKQMDYFKDYMENPKNFGKPEYIRYALNFDNYLATFEGLYSVVDSKPLNATQRRLAFTLQAKANDLVGTKSKEGVIDKAVTSYVRNIVKTRSNQNFSEEELDHLMQFGRDIGIVELQTKDLATSPDTLLALMDKIYKAKKQELLDKIQKRESTIRNLASKLQKLSSEKDPQKMFDFMLEMDENGEFTGRYVQEIGQAYYDLLEELRSQLYDENGQPYQYRDVTNLETASQEDIDYNIDLALKRRKFGDFFNAETIGAGNEPIDGEYHYYTDDFKQERKKYMYFVPVGRNGFWKRRTDISDDAYYRFKAKYYTTGVDVEGKTIMKNDKNGNPTGAILKDQIFDTVKPEYRKRRLISRSGKDMRSEKFIAIQENKSALGLAQKDFYDFFRVTFENDLLQKLPKAQRDQMLGRVPLIRANVIGSIKDKGAFFTDMFAKTSRGIKNLFRTTAQQRSIFVDENGNLIDSLPIFYTGVPATDKQLADIDEQIQSLEQEMIDEKISKVEYKDKLALLQGKRASLENKPSKGELNKDMASGLLKFLTMAEHYDTMSTVEDTMKAMLKVIEKREYQPEDSRITTGIKNALGFEQRGSVKGTDSNILKRAKKWMNMVYYDNDQLTKGFGEKLADGLIKWSSLSYVAFNPFGNFNNYVLGRLNDNIEAIGGRFYSAKAFARASMEYNKRAVPDMIHRLASMAKKPLNATDYDPTLPTSKYEAAVSLFRMMDKDADIRETGADMESINKSWLSKATEWGYVLQDAAEWNVQTKVGIAMLMDTYIRKGGEGGEILSLYDALEFDAETKGLKLKEGFKTIVKYDPENLSEDGKSQQIIEVGEYNVDFRYDFRNKIREVNKQIHGNYAKEDRMVLQSSTVGKLAAQFHKWVAPAIRARFQQQYFDENLGWMEGRYRSWWKFMSYAFGQIAKGDMKFRDYGENFMEEQGYIQKFDGSYDKNKEVARNQLFGFYRTMGEIGIMMLTFVMKEILMSSFADDDDDNEILKRFKNIAIYQADRSFKELILFVPILGSDQQYQMIKSPIASSRTMGELGQALWSTVETPYYAITQSNKEFYKNKEVVYQRGSRAGTWKLKKEWQDAVPILYSIKKWQNYLDMRNFYIK